MDKELEKRLNELMGYTLSDMDLRPAKAAIAQVKKMTKEFSIDPDVIPYFVAFYQEAQKYFSDKEDKSI